MQGVMNMSGEISPPKCPTCGTPALWCDPHGVWWLCAKCNPDGQRFSIRASEAEKYAEVYRARFAALTEAARQYKLPIAR